MHALGYIATSSLDSSVKIWDPNSNWTLIQKYSNHSSFDVYGLEYINADTIASGDTNGTIQIWSISTGLTLRTIYTGSIVYTLKIFGLSVTNGYSVKYLKTWDYILLDKFAWKNKLDVRAE